MSNQIRPSSELFMNNNTTHDSRLPDSTVTRPQHKLQLGHQAPDTSWTNHSLKSQKTEYSILQSHPTILKPRHRYPRLSRIPIESVNEGTEINSAKGQPQNTTNLSVLDTILQVEHQINSTRQRIDDLYNFASFVMPPYLAKQLAELDVMDEDAWMTKFPKDVDTDSKLGAVQSLLIELGLVVARLSEKVKKEQEQNDVD